MQATSKGDVLEILRNLAATCLHRHSVEVVANFQVKCWELKRSVHRFCPIPRYSRERYYRVVLYESNNNQSIISTSILFLYLFLSYKILIILTNWSDDLINFPKKRKGKIYFRKEARNDIIYVLSNPSEKLEKKNPNGKNNPRCNKHFLIIFLQLLQLFIPRLKTPDSNSRIKIVSPFSLLFFWNPKIIYLKWDRKQYAFKFVAKLFGQTIWLLPPRRIGARAPHSYMRFPRKPQPQFPRSSKFPLPNFRRTLHSMHRSVVNEKFSENREPNPSPLHKIRDQVSPNASNSFFLRGYFKIWSKEHRANAVSPTLPIQFHATFHVFLAREFVNGRLNFEAILGIGTSL